MTTIIGVPGPQAWVEQAVAAMRDWIAECTWNDLDADAIDELTPSEVVAGVRKHYEGGVRQFLRDSWMLVD